MVMKSLLRIIFSFSFALPCLLSCSDTDVAPDPTAGLVKIAEGYAEGAGAKVTLYAGEKLFAGYNPVWIALQDSTNGSRITDAHISFHPLMSMATMSHGCPVENPGEKALNGLFSGSMLFTMPSGEMGTWSLEIRVHHHTTGSFGTMRTTVDVLPATPSRAVSFTAEDGIKYYLGYRFQKALRVGANLLEVIAFRREGDAYVPAEDLEMTLEPEMPSMDHGSPNNVDPVHTSAGHYAGIANFTMTGEWRLNLTLQAGGVSLGTKYFDVIVP